MNKKMITILGLLIIIALALFFSQKTTIKNEQIKQIDQPSIVNEPPAQNIIPKLTTTSESDMGGLGCFLPDPSSVCDDPGPTHATLNGTYAGLKNGSTVWFQYWNDRDNIIHDSSKENRSGSGSTSAKISGFPTGSKMSFRLMAKNDGSTITGNTVVFFVPTP